MEQETGWREGFGPLKNFGMAPSMPDPQLVLRGLLRSGESRGGEERKGRRRAGSSKRGGEESWNRAADWLRLALRERAAVGQSYTRRRRSARC